MHRTLMSVIVGASALACAPSLAHADPQESRRTVYVYDGHDTYYVPGPRQILRRVFGQPERHHRQPAPTPQPVYAPPSRFDAAWYGMHPVTDADMRMVIALRERIAGCVENA